MTKERKTVCLYVDYNVTDMGLPEQVLGKPPY